MPAERKIFGIRIPRLLPDGDFSVFNRLGSKPFQETTSEVKLTASQKVLQAIDSLDEAATADQILKMVRSKHSSVFPPLLDKWGAAFTQLKEAGEIIGEANPDYTVRSSYSDLYRRTTEEEKKMHERNRRNDLSRAI